jgi:DNA-binding transcriptional ArsR family regulator
LRARPTLTDTAPPLPPGLACGFDLAARRTRLRLRYQARQREVVWRSKEKLVNVPLSSSQLRACTRLRELRDLADWRRRNGVGIDDPLGWVRLVLDAIAVLQGCRRWEFTTTCVRQELFGHPDLLGVIAEEIDALIDRAGPGTRVVSAAEAGRRIQLVAIELSWIERDRLVFRTIDPHDETAEDRAVRRAARRRAKTRERVARFRARIANATNSVTPSKKGRERYIQNVAKTPAKILCLLAERSEMALADFATLIPEPPATLRMALSRMVRAGQVERAGRGRYRSVPS